MRPLRSSWVVTLATLASAASAAALAAANAPVFWKLSEQCLFYDDWAGFVETCRRGGGVAGPFLYAARGLMQLACCPWGAALVMAVLSAGSSVSLALAFPRLRRPAFAGTLLLPSAWLAATLYLPALPIWLLPRPEFPAFVPLVTMLAAGIAAGIRRWRGTTAAAVAFVLVLVVVGGLRLLAPFVGGDAAIPRLRLADEAPVFAAEAAIEAGDFDGVARRPTTAKGRRLETAYRVLANCRLGRVQDAKNVPGAGDYGKSEAPEALMDGYKLLFHYGLVLPARRLLMELASECPSEEHAVHDLYLGDIAYVTGEFGLAERYYRELARSPLHRAKALARVSAMRAGKSAGELAELNGVARLYAAWKRLAATSGQAFYAHGQNLEAFVYGMLAKVSEMPEAERGTLVFERPTMRPDFLGATVPPNIAPFNFDLPGLTDASTVRAVFAAADGETLKGRCRAAPAGGSRIEAAVKVTFDVAAWRGFLARHRGSEVGLTVVADARTLVEGKLRIAAEPIDPRLVFRLIAPGYGVYGRMSVTERNLENFDERTLDDNFDRASNVRNCINCHTPLRNEPDEYLRHYRGLVDGVRFVTRRYGERFAPSPKPEGWTGRGGLSYSAWHPSGEFVAFSATETTQQFYLADPAKIEVMDLRGKLALFSVGDGKLTNVPGRPGDFECYPTWDPTGRLLFTCCAETTLINDVEDVRIRTESVVGVHTNMFYGVRVRRFDRATQTFSAPEPVIDGNASRMSCAFPRVSPDGRWMVLTVSRFGVFPIWHKSADLWLLDLKTLNVRPLEELNSTETESWHEFSSDGRWMVFSSRRGDGTFTRPWIARFDAATGRFDRPFPVPLEDPDDDFRRMKSYNLPTFLKR